jgi:tetrahydromethanopterin S-methyltransferase F subunit
MASNVKKEEYTAKVALLEAKINDIQTRVEMIGRENRYASGLTVGMTKGFMVGLIFSLILFGVVFHYFIP